MWAAQSLAHFDVDHRRPKMSYDPVRNWNHVAAQPGRKSITLIQIDKSVIYQPSITVNLTGKPVVLIGGLQRRVHDDTDCWRGKSADGRSWGFLCSMDSETTVHGGITLDGTRNFGIDAVDGVMFLTE